jgi:hypothetical protein
MRNVAKTGNEAMRQAGAYAQGYNAGVQNQVQQPAQPVQQPQAVVPQPANQITSTEDLAAAMGYTSPEQEEKMRKASLMNRRILAVGDALRHIGNIANTINYAPAQKFNSPVQEEELRYQRGKLLRDKANTTYIKYQQAKEAQDRAAAKMEMEFKLKQADDARKDRLNDARISRYNAQNAKDGANQAYWETRARLLEEGWPLDKAIKEAKKAEIDERARLARAKANQGGFAPRSGGRRGGGSEDKYTLVDEDNKTHHYPNKTMYEQGVAQYNKTVPTHEEVKTGKQDIHGRDITKSKPRKSTDIGADMAKKGAEKARRTGRTGRGSAKSKFSIHQK